MSNNLRAVYEKTAFAEWCWYLLRLSAVVQRFQDIHDVDAYALANRPKFRAEKSRLRRQTLSRVRGCGCTDPEIRRARVRAEEATYEERWAAAEWIESERIRRST